MIRESDGMLGHVSAGFGQVAVSEDECVTRAHIDIHEFGCDHVPCNGSRVVMEPREWAQLIKEMVRIAYTLGGTYREHTESELRQQRHHFN